MMLLPLWLGFPLSAGASCRTVSQQGTVDVTAPAVTPKLDQDSCRFLTADDVVVALAGSGMAVMHATIEARPVTTLAALGDAPQRMRVPRISLAPDETLQLKAVRYDRLANRTIIDLRLKNSQPSRRPRAIVRASIPGILLLPPFPAGRTSDAEEIPGDPGRDHTNPAQPAPLLARPGVHIPMQAIRRGYSISRVVVPLQPGRLGEVIRVRDRDTRQVFLARVVGEARLQSLSDRETAAAGTSQREKANHE